MKIAVTGANGFLGRHVISELIARGGFDVVATSRSAWSGTPLPQDVYFVQMDIGQTDIDAFSRLGRPDVVLHLAWGGLPNYRSRHHFEQEIPLQYGYLRRLVEAGLQALVVTGTCFEYGLQSGALDESTPPRPANPYAFAKDALRQQLGYLASEFPFRLVWSRLFYMYGPGQATSSLYTQLMAAIERGDSVFKMSGGEQLRDFLPVADVARGLCDLAVSPEASGVFNVCSGQPIAVRRLVESLLVGCPSPPSLALGSFPYSDLEPMAFWGDRQRLDSIVERNNAAKENTT